LPVGVPGLCYRMIEKGVRTEICVNLSELFKIFFSQIETEMAQP